MNKKLLLSAAVAGAAMIAAGCSSMRAVDAAADCRNGVMTDWHAHMTLYTFDKDGANPPKSNCTGYCETVWPPFKAQASDRDGGGYTKFKRDDGTLQWAYQGKPQEGSLLIGRQTRVGNVRACWIDTWHMGDQFMLLGGGEVGGKLSVVGTYPAPPGPDWGWRIELQPEGDRRLHLTMMNITPDGEEQPAVATTLDRR